MDTFLIKKSLDLIDFLVLSTSLEVDKTDFSAKSLIFLGMPRKSRKS